MVFPGFPWFSHGFPMDFPQRCWPRGPRMPRPRRLAADRHRPGGLRYGGGAEAPGTNRRSKVGISYEAWRKPMGNYMEIYGHIPMCSMVLVYLPT